LRKSCRCRAMYLFRIERMLFRTVGDTASGSKFTNYCRISLSSRSEFTSSMRKTVISVI
jgi:hypothetical protein